ncbi:MAG: hypothetical protein M1829_006882 [Trizodia sp. TS-e1964]|nr:MAG: hypothetical protein M1829_006882 [Trizodia sp. TS-e1964]
MDTKRNSKIVSKILDYNWLIDTSPFGPFLPNRKLDPIGTPRRPDREQPNGTNPPLSRPAVLLGLPESLLLKGPSSPSSLHFCWHALSPVLYPTSEASNGLNVFAAEFWPSSSSGLNIFAEEFRPLSRSGLNIFAAEFSPSSSAHRLSPDAEEFQPYFWKKDFTNEKYWKMRALRAERANREHLESMERCAQWALS